MARTVLFTFDTRSVSANNGQIVVSMANTDAPGTPYDFYIQITAPSGEVIKEMPDTPDATLNGGTTGIVTVDIPLDSNGDYLEGEYAFVTRRDDQAADDTTVNDTYTYTSHNNPDNLDGSVTFTVTLSCLTGRILAKDDTDYTTLGLTLDDREISIIPPAIDTQDDAVSASTQATLVVAYTNVTYEAVLSVSLTWDEEDLGSSVTAASTGTITKLVEVDVECETGGICESLECIGEQLTKAYNEACAAGGYSRLASASKDKIEWAMMNLSMAKFKYDCGEVVDSATYLTRAKEGINCGCGCSGTTSNSTPQPFTPPASDSAGAQLGYWTEAQNSTGSSFVPVKAGVDDFDAIIAPKGDGAIRFRTGGNARGANALDLQPIAAGGDGYVASGDQSIAIGVNNRALNTDSVAIGDTNTSGADSENGVVIGKENVTQKEDSVAIGTTNTLNSHSSHAIGNLLTGNANHEGVFLRGNAAVAHQKYQDVFGIGNLSLQRSIITLNRVDVAGSAAFKITAGGSSTNDLDFPAGNWVFACRLLFAASITITDGGFSVGDTFLGQRQFVISSNGGTVALQGSVQSVGTDVATASMSGLTLGITADNTNDLLQIEVTPPGAMGAGDSMTCLAQLEILQIKLP